MSRNPEYHRLSAELVELAERLKVIAQRGGETLDEQLKLAERIQTVAMHLRESLRDSDRQG
jgi:hypothetical protein